MSEELVFRHCSPTLAGFKTANMFSFTVESFDKLKEHLRKWNKILKPKGLRAIPLRYKEGKALVYIYRPNNLSADLKDDTARDILNKKGYDTANSVFCLKKLQKELQKNESFPHEIGLFLGYPPKDVNGYIQDPKAALKIKGQWKVYSEPEEAEKLFRKFDKCTKVYCKRVKEGKPIDRMIVAA